MKGIAGKSTSRDDQKSKDPENDRMKTGKRKLIPEVVIEKRVPKGGVERAPNLAKEVSMRDSANGKVSKEPSQAEEVVSDNEDVPEWRRTAPKPGSRKEEGKGLPFKDVPSMVVGPGSRPPSFGKKVRFEDEEKREEPNFRRKAPVEEGLTLEELTKEVLKQPITLSLGELAGVSPMVRESLRTQLTRRKVINGVFNATALSGDSKKG